MTPESIPIPSTIERNAAFFIPIILKIIEEGGTRTEIQSQTRLSYAAMKRYADIGGIRIPRKYMEVKPESSERAAEMKALRDGGSTLMEIGRVFGITRERARQILSRSFPDSVFPSIAPKRKKHCIGCGCEMGFITRTPYCRTACRKRSTANQKYSRDMAVKVMLLMDQDNNWEQIAWKLETPGLRQHLQRYLPIIFSTEEREKYFRTNSK